LFGLLTAASAAVQYEAAGSLISLSSAPSAVKASASAFIDLLVKVKCDNL
jgi:coatomer subunit beta